MRGLVARRWLTRGAGAGLNCRRLGAKRPEPRDLAAVPVEQRELASGLGQPPLQISALSVRRPYASRNVTGKIAGCAFGSGILPLVR